MAPDINSMPSSPRQDRPQPSRHSSGGAAVSSNRGSRRTSQILPPPASAIQPASVSPMLAQHTRSRSITDGSETGVPIRHPRPLTAAEMYEQLEKEQEAMVNRLTRELTTLRAQSASVASNASSSASASMLPVDITDPNPTHQMVGATHPTPNRRRGSSSVSSRGIQTPSSSTTPSSAHLSTQAQAGSVTSLPVAGQSQAAADRAAAFGGSTHSLSRQPSISASGRSTPARQSLDTGRAGTLYTLPHRPSISREQSHVSTQTTSSIQANAGTPLPSAMPPPPPQSPNTLTISTPHYTDTAAYRTEMEIVKAENEALRQRVRALERALQARRRDSSQSQSDPRLDHNLVSPTTTRSPREDNRAGMYSNHGGAAAWTADGGVGGVAGPRERSESQSTTASSRRGVAAEEDAVRFGESAGSVGIGRGV